MYAHTAGAVGVLVMTFAGLTAIKVQLGVPWPVAVLITVGALVLLGYAAWWVKTRIVRLWNKGPAEASSPAVVVQEFSAQSADEAEGPAAHAELTTVMVTSGAIGGDQIIRADEASVTDLRNGALYDFQMPEGRTYEHVEKNLSTIAGMFRVTRLHMKLERSRDNERRVQMLKLHEPPFTRPFAAPTRGEIEAFSGVPLGHDVTGNLVGVPTFDKASLLVAGMTQMGKTTLINGLITCLLIAYGEFELYLLDGKFCGLTRFEKIATRYESSDDPDVFEAMVDSLNDRSDRRYAKIKEAVRDRKSPPRFKPVIFIVDEAADFFASDESKEGKEKARRIAEKTRSLVSKSLESGISTVLMTQRPSQNAIPVMVRDQFLYRMCLYVASAGTAKVALGDTYFETVAPIHPALLDPEIKGQAVLFANGRSALVRGFNFSDDFIWGIVDEVGDQREKQAESQPQSPRQKVIALMASKGVDFIATSDVAQIVGVTQTVPADMGKEVSQLMGVSPRNLSRGRGYRLADLTTAETAAS
ncbi:FtsK/SpoIIIE domain-containing protein (plasmid) [Streptomyces sp. NBC_01343]|uniref:FtsK/SpoIIIE domain-containing protein n=1 Tax=Streptomyces sp. NBC_01343 TaxID=2903832 RepID=UPI002E1211DE|nr:FtsK/SpoIIIE domain-containing protein [Streptomyces sp. NBC_01343]